MKTPIRYAGGKSKAYNKITPFMNFDKPIVSPFIGGGSLESRWAEQTQVFGYDIFFPLTNWWNAVLETPNDIANSLQQLTPDKETYDFVKEELMQWEYTQTMLKDWNTNHYVRDSKELDDLTAAAYYFFNHNLSYGPMYLGWMSKIYQNQKKWDASVSRIRNYKNPNLVVQDGGFADVIPISSGQQLYLDPPYYLDKDGDNKMFKGIYPNANIDVHHTGFEHEKLRDLLHSHTGSFVLSYNNCETIREWYADFDFYYPEWHYSYALGETRIGKNKDDNAPKESHEILIVKT